MSNLVMPVIWTVTIWDVNGTSCLRGLFVLTTFRKSTKPWFPSSVIPEKITLARIVSHSKGVHIYTHSRTPITWSGEKAFVRKEQGSHIFFKDMQCTSVSSHVKVKSWLGSSVSQPVSESLSGNEKVKRWAVPSSHHQWVRTIPSSATTTTTINFFCSCYVCVNLNLHIIMRTESYCLFLI